ncbi:ABC transporter ATP-binding protein [Alistipes onderdonkii]|nr:ABC transporter ATP-binding protein [Alistipes onderdonkii]
MKPPFLDIIPHRFRRRSLGVTLSVFTRALLNFAGLAVLIPVLVIILDTEGIRSNRWLAALYDFGGFTSDRTFILTVCACVVAVILFKSLANLALYKIERNFIYDLYRELSRRLYVDYRNRGLGFIKSSNSAVLARNVNVVCLTFVTGVLMPVAAMASEAVLFALLFGSLAIYNPLVALLTLAIFVPSVALYYYLVRQRLNRYGEEENRAQRRKSRTVIETFRGYTDLEIAGAYPAMLSDFDRSMDEIIRVRQRNATIAALPPMFTEVGLAVGMAVLVAFCAGTDNTQMKLLFGIFAVASLRIMPSVRSIMGAWTSLRYNRYTIDVLRDARLYDTPAGIDTTQERMPFEREIRIEGLSFHFDDAPDRDILHDLSLTIRKGERIGIRGASGVGKTTLFNILLGFYRPTQGEVLLDGRPLGQYSESCWRRDCGVVMQEATIFADTIARNIGVVDEQPDMERVRRAARMANIDEWIESLPMRYDTKIGLDGHGLSTGQRQRLFIARAAYKDAKYLFLDEATNSLDAANERSIMEKLQSFFEGRTVVVVAHRLSTVMNADNIVVLDRGRIVEQGTHKELTARRGHYYNLVRNQLELGN